MKNLHARKPTQGFTLVELLVVIVVIAILAGMLLPALNRSREKARQARCLSNVHQLALAMLQYAQDNAEALPPVEFMDAGGDDVEWDELVAPYLKSVAIFLCPSDKLSEESSYGLNELAFVDLTDAAPPPATKLADIRTPTTTVMLGDVGTEDDLFTPRADTSKMVAPGSALDDDADGRPFARHLNLCNLGFMDGHAEPMRLLQFYTGQTPPDKWFTP